jgi:hypothetical protein
MARKSAASLPQKEMPQGELEDEVNKRTRVVELVQPSRKGRTRNAHGVPSGDVESGEVRDIIANSIELNAEALEWHYGEQGNEGTSKQWAEIILRAIRYGVPYDDYMGEGFRIRDADDMGEAPLCPECQAEEDDNE